jgi:glycine/D-amino acid oxidase-like deaminating enzyme
MERESTLPEETDVLIVGGGIIGTSTAFHLADRTEYDITLVEKDNIAAGATGDSSAILRHHYYDRDLYSRMAWEGHQFYRNFEEETGKEIAIADQPFVRFGKSGTDVGERIAAGHDVMTEHDIPATKYEADELAEQYPLFEFGDEFDFAVSDDAAGYSDGTDAATGFAAAARNRGATITTGVSVESIDTEDGAVVGALTDEGRIECDRIVIAAGAWSSFLAETVGVDLPVTPTREQVLLLDPAEAVSDEELASIPTTGSGMEEWYFRPDFGGKIYMGTHSQSEECDPRTFDRTADEEKILDAVDFFSSVVPELDGAKLIGSFAGIYTTTPDDEFIIDQVGPDGCYALIGAGHAFKHGPVIGRLATDLIVDGESEWFDLSRFSLDRFDRQVMEH